MPGESVLLVEHETSDRSFLEQQLAEDGSDVLAAQDGKRAVELVATADPDLVLLDAVLPDGSGFELCRRLREGEPGARWNREIPIIMVSERSDPIDRVRGFARGCDDYVARPFVYEELVARMRAILRRVGGRSCSERLIVRDLEIDLHARTVRRGGIPVHLPTKEYELLATLAREPARVFTKEELLRSVWGFRSAGRTRTVDSHASRLRRRLGDDLSYVFNVWGVGYRLVGWDRGSC